MSQKTLSVSAIKTGTVIDHITAGAALRIVAILHLAAEKKQVTIGLNLPSKSMGHKDLIKVEDRELTPEEVNQVAILAPRTTINIVKNYAVTKKFLIQIPKTIEHVIVCPNDKCITNHEQMRTRFKILNHTKGILLECEYCNKQCPEEEIREYRT